MSAPRKQYLIRVNEDIWQISHANLKRLLQEDARYAAGETNTFWNCPSELRKYATEAEDLLTIDFDEEHDPVEMLKNLEEGKL